jgi:hypothetical protein
LFFQFSWRVLWYFQAYISCLPIECWSFTGCNTATH